MNPKAQPGPGKYGQHSDRVLEQESADGCVIIVLGGPKGAGFSVSARGEVAEQVHSALPRLLRSLADQLEQATTN